MADCELCGRQLVTGPTIDEHHLIPKLKGGRHGPKVTLHKICHRFIHATFTEAELARVYNTIDRLLEHEAIQRFVGWVSNKAPEFYDSPREQNSKKRKRK
jgi:hypothetical protein